MIFSYGHRNSFGMAFDPHSGDLWNEENGDDTFSELNRVDPGMNGGWVQFMGPVSRIAQFKEIETTFGGRTCSSSAGRPRTSPTARRKRCRGCSCSPARTTATRSSAGNGRSPRPASASSTAARLGPQYEGDLFVGAATPILEGGYLFRFNLTGNRRKIAVDDPRLEDRVADNLAKHEITESESLLFGGTSASRPTSRPARTATSSSSR